MERGSFTGRHMTGILMCFFGLVVIVNFVMARFAVATFGGSVVENSYVASQKYNAWLADARRQEALGWTVVTRLDAKRRVHVSARRMGGPLPAPILSAMLRHPLGRAPERAFAFEALAGGEFVSRDAVPAGRWILHLHLRSRSERYTWMASFE